MKFSFMGLMIYCSFNNFKITYKKTLPKKALHCRQYEIETIKTTKQK